MVEKSWLRVRAVLSEELRRKKWVEVEVERGERVVGFVGHNGDGAVHAHRRVSDQGADHTEGSGQNGHKMQLDVVVVVAGRIVELHASDVRGLQLEGRCHQLFDRDRLVELRRMVGVRPPVPD